MNLAVLRLPVGRRLTRGLFGQILGRIGGAFARRGRSGLIPAEEVCAGGGTVRVFTIRGIPINVHVSWLVIYGLITWTLAVGYFPRALPDLPAAAYWANGLLAAFLLFVSVLLHELPHSLVAIAHGLSVRGITLHVFGGVSHLEDEPPSPRAEFLIAVVGPVTSFAIAAVLWLISAAISSPDSRSTADGSCAPPSGSGRAPWVRPRTSPAESGWASP